MKKTDANIKTVSLLSGPGINFFKDLPGPSQKRSTTDYIQSI